MWTQLLLGALFLGAAGCGLPDYEQKIDAQRTRVAEFDELNRVLDDPVEMPTLPAPKAAKDSKEEVPAWPPELFLRLPRGFGSAPKEKALGDPSFPMFRYAGGELGFSIFVAIASIQEAKKPAEVGNYPIDYFRFKVREGLFKHQLIVNKADLPIPTKIEYVARRVKVYSPYPERAEIRFDHLELSDAAIKGRVNPSTFEIFLREEAGRQAAIVLHRPAGKQSAEHRKIIDASLGTLDLTPESAGKRAQFKKAK
jgi:hypothetical protein